ncbi:MAG: PEGA domain-containing protein [Myxococcota bacterium]
MHKRLSLCAFALALAASPALAQPEDPANAGGAPETVEEPSGLSPEAAARAARQTVTGGIALPTGPNGLPTMPFPDPLPILVVPQPRGALDGDFAVAALDKVVAGLAARTSARPVRAAPQLAQPMLACDSLECAGQLVAGANGVAAVVVGLTPPARRRQPAELRLTLMRPVSGESVGEDVVVSVPFAGQEDPETLNGLLQPALDALRPRLPGPPPRPTLLVAVSVDDAAVSLDGTRVGGTPLPPVEVPAGRHTLSITRRGYQPFNQSVEVGLDGTRINATLEPNEELLQQIAAEEEAARYASTGGKKPWYKRWQTWAIAGGVVAAAVIVGVAVAASGGGGLELPEQTVPVPPVQEP